MSTLCFPSCDGPTDCCFISIVNREGSGCGGMGKGFCHVSNEALPVMQHIFPLNRSSAWPVGLSVRWIDSLSPLQRHWLTECGPASQSCFSLTHFSFQNPRAHLFIESQKPFFFFFFFRRRRRCCVRRRDEKEKIIGLKRQISKHLPPPPSLVLGQQEGELEEKQLINSHKVRRRALGRSVPC